MKLMIKELFLNQEVYYFQNDDLEIWVNPDDGMNICKLCYHGNIVIDSDQKRLEAGMTYGTAILYPTPNRVFNGCFVYSGKEYSAQMHGVVKKEKFLITDSFNNETMSFLEGIVKFSKGNALYEKFPFESTLTIKITLFPSSIKISYTVDNRDNKELPFGFGIHPFFQKGNNPVNICINAEKIMDMNLESYPTGKLRRVEGTSFDLRKAVLVECLNLDHVYTNLSGYPKATIEYPDFKLKIDTSEDFSHLVIYTPQGQNFFCVENQTCSTDAHNLYAKGFHGESGLIIVPPKVQKSGEISYCFEELKGK